MTSLQLYFVFSYGWSRKNQKEMAPPPHHVCAEGAVKIQEKKRAEKGKYLSFYKKVAFWKGYTYFDIIIG